MSRSEEMKEQNGKIIEEFRANQGWVGGPFAGAPVVLVHNVGRKTGITRINPVMYLPDEHEPNTIYVFATNAGLASHPAWYYNLTAVGRTTIERGTETYDVTVEEVTGADRDRIYAEQARRFPGFADYELSNEGVRTIPVLRLART